MHRFGWLASQEIRHNWAWTCGKTACLFQHAPHVRGSESLLPLLARATARRPGNAGAEIHKVCAQLDGAWCPPGQEGSKLILFPLDMERFRAHVPRLADGLEIVTQPPCGRILSSAGRMRVLGRHFHFSGLTSSRRSNQKNQKTNEETKATQAK